MLNANHSADEQLSALAAGEPDATADASLVAHVSDCDRCTVLVSELGALRLSLAELPDLRPSRPLALLPAVEEAPPRDGLLVWVRRLFAPALTAGAALAMVGLIGTAAPALQGTAGAPGSEAFEAQQPQASAAAAEGGQGGTAAMPSGDEVQTLSTDKAAADEGSDTRAAAPAPLPAERSPWPMVLFTGVALIVAAALLRWIVVPRAG